jgi:hypothetical protein
MSRLFRCCCLLIALPLVLITLRKRALDEWLSEFLR